MPAVPATSFLVVEIQDNRGFRSTVRVEGFDADVSTDTSVVGADVWANWDPVVAAIQAMTNAKVIGASFGWRYDIAQEPSSETGEYQLVIQKAHLQGGDGAGAFMSISVPAPKDALFLTHGQDNLIVVDPAATILTNFQSACGTAAATARGGHPFSQFFGGQLRAARPRRRRVTQGA